MRTTEDIRLGWAGQHLRRTSTCGRLAGVDKGLIVTATSTKLRPLSPSLTVKN